MKWTNQPFGDPPLVHLSLHVTPTARSNNGRIRCTSTPCLSSSTSSERPSPSRRSPMTSPLGWKHQTKHQTTCFFIDQWLLIYQIYTWLWSTTTASFIICFYHFEYRWLYLHMTFCWLIVLQPTYLTRKADTGMEWAPQIWRGRTHFDPQRLFYGLNRMGMWWQTFLPAISCHVKSHICSLSVQCIL